MDFVPRAGLRRACAPTLQTSVGFPGGKGKGNEVNRHHTPLADEACPRHCEASTGSRSPDDGSGFDRRCRRLELAPRRRRHSQATKRRESEGEVIYGGPLVSRNIGRLLACLLSFGLMPNRALTGSLATASLDY